MNTNLMIENIIEPIKLLFIWKDEEGNKYKVGEIIKKNKEEADLIYTETEEDFINAKNKGFNGYPSFPLSQIRWENVMSTFSRRIMQRKRPDFNKWLEFYKIPTTFNENISDFALLGYTGGILASDHFMFIHPFEVSDQNYEFITEVAGIRHRENINLDKLIEGDSVSFVPEPENKIDINAIKIIIKTQHIGYINKCFAKRFNEILQNNLVKAYISKKNGTKDNPKIYLFIEVKSN